MAEDKNTIEDALMDYIKKAFNISLIFGTILGIFYLVSYVEALPEISSISSLLSSVVALSAVFLFYTIVFLFFSLSSSLVVLMGTLDRKDETPNKKDATYDENQMSWYYIVTALVLYVGFCLAIFLEQYYGYILLGIIAIVLVILFLNNLYAGGKLTDDLPIAQAIALILFVFTTISFLGIYLPEYSQENYIVYLVVLMWIMLATGINILVIQYAPTKSKTTTILHRKEIVSLDNKDNVNKKSHTPIFVVKLLVGFLLISAFILSLAGKQNLFVVKSFEILKIGNYKETLYFKKENLDMLKKELFNDSNVSSAKFCILSNIGSEFIVHKIITKITINDKNQSIVSEECNATRTYRINKENLAGFRYFDKVTEKKNILNLDSNSSDKEKL